MAMIKIASMIFGRLPIIQRYSMTNPESNYLSKILQFSCNYSVDAGTNGVSHIKNLLKNKFPLAKNIEVIDISGGCGEMFDVFVETIEFKGLTVVQQHKLINETLKNEMKAMHGLRIQTVVPPENAS